MKFVFYRYNNICEGDVITALLQLGHEVDTIDIEIMDKKPDSKIILDTFCKMFESSRYDGVISINYFPLISKICNIYNVLYLAWTTDCPVNELLSETVSNSCNRIFCFDYAQYEETKHLNQTGVFYMPLATNVSRWDGIIGKSNSIEIEKYSSDISFVGSLYSEICAYDRIKGLPEYLKGYLDGIMQAQLGIYGSYFLDQVISEDMVESFVSCVDDFPKFVDNQMNNPLWIMAHKYLGFKVTALERAEVVSRFESWINDKEYSFKLYTGSEHRGKRIKNMGTVQTHTQMPLVFNNSRINLNITCKPIRTGIAQRVWDIMGAQGFVLTNYQQEITEFFNIGEDIETYASMDELIDKTEYYLKHDEQRKKIAASGYEKVKSQHTFEQRVADILYIAFA